MRGMLITGLLVLAFGLFQSAQAQQADLPEVPDFEIDLPDVPDLESFRALAANKFQRGMIHDGGFGMGVAEGGERQKGAGLEMLLRHRGELGLDESQVNKLKGIRLETVRQTSQIGSRLKVADLELHDMLDNPDVDMKAVEVKVREVYSLRGDLRLARIKARVETMNVLTPEQREKVTELQDRRPAWPELWKPGPEFREKLRELRKSLGKGTENGE